MSAAMVSKRHIDTLVAAALKVATSQYSTFGYGVPGRKWQVVTKHYADRLGLKLWGTNYAGIENHYGKGTLMAEDWREDVLSYQYQEPDDIESLTIGALIKAVHGYMYQACEHKYWDRSEAKFFCEELVDGLIRASAEYQDANTWYIEDDEKETANV